MMQEEKKIMGERDGDFGPYRVVSVGGVGEMEEKKSRFIATLRPAASEQEALAFLEEMKKKYWDARHNCSAYIIGRKAELVRCSDDGEPSGTAGRPMLEVLMGEKLRDTAVVVTRYFGGTLLGTGGLVRAYTQAVQAGLSNSTIVTMRYTTVLKIGTDYQGIGKIQYLLGKNGILVQDTVYTEQVWIEALVPYERVAQISKEMIQATSGKAQIEPGDSYYCVDKKQGV